MERNHSIDGSEIEFSIAFFTCMNESASGKGSFILKSISGKPEGPYVNIEGNKDKPLFPNIDGSLFEDTDGTVYFIGHNHYIRGWISQLIRVRMFMLPVMELL